MKAVLESRQGRARMLRATGLTHREIGRRLGVSDSTVRRWLDPAQAERMRRGSRAAKQRRKGRCACGRSLSYDSVSGRCIACSNRSRVRDETDA